MGTPTATAPPGHLPSPYVRPRGEFRDWCGRRYTVGASARELTGHSRGFLVGRAALAVAGVGVLQFGYGAAVPVLVAAHGWSLPQALLPLLVWTLFQGGSAVPIARLRGRGVLRPDRAVTAGALLCAAALLALGLAQRPEWAVAGYGVLGGIGAGLVYHSCVHLASVWYPERPATHAGPVSGAFALGSVPAAAGALLLDPSALAPACTALAAAVGALGLVCGRHLPQPPPRWWPPRTDPRSWALRGRAEPLASFDHSPAQAWRSGALSALHAIVALAGAAALLDLAVLPAFLLHFSHSPPAVAAVMAVLVAASGLGRIAAGRWSARAGRRRILVGVLLAGAVAQFGLLAAGSAGSAAALVCFAVPAGVGGGSCYPLTRTLAMDFFGARDSTDIRGLVYSAKGVGGLLGVGGAAALLAAFPAWGYAPAFCAAGVAALAAAVVAARLRRPLPVRTIPL
ncbi:MAG: MFS transporter [Nocardiopsaceae bacterium]|nr:MFS transporter [Nocardiopsaceae bacterium]